MAALLQRKNLSLARLLLARTWQSRLVASDSLVELKPDEIGIVYGIPQEHLRRRVCSRIRVRGHQYTSFEEPACLEHPRKVRQSKFRRLQFLLTWILADKDLWSDFSEETDIWNGEF